MSIVYASCETLKWYFVALFTISFEFGFIESANIANGIETLTLDQVADDLKNYER